MKTKVATRVEMIALINAKYPRLFTKTSEEFDGTKGGIWSGNDSETFARDGFEIFNYYSQDHTKTRRYTFGVHKELNDLLEKNGWYAEWYDPGTIMFWEK